MKFHVTLFKISQVANVIVDASGFAEAAVAAERSPTLNWGDPDREIKFEVRREDEIPINPEPVKIKREENKSFSRRTK